MRSFAALLLLVAGCDDDDVHIGDRCSSNDACQAAGFACETSPPGGYCTALCTMQGVRAECPEEAVCDAIGNVTGACVKICDDGSDCRPDQQCSGVTGTNIKACKP
jgi:hypothetical protein